MFRSDLAEKNILVVVECLDGVGDLEHFKAYCNGIKKRIPDVNLVGFISVYQANTAQLKKAKDFCLKQKSDFQNLYIHVKQGIWQTTQDELTEQELKTVQDQVSANETLKKELSELLDIKEFADKLKKTDYCIMISTEFLDEPDSPASPSATTLIQHEVRKHIRFLKSSNNFLWLPEYGEGIVSSEGEFVRGITNFGGKNFKGIRLVEEWEATVTEDKRITSMMSLKNKTFLGALLSITDREVSPVNVSAYFKTHRLLPAYIQSEWGILLFVKTQVLANLKHEKPLCLDFYLPTQYVSKAYKLIESLEIEQKKQIRIFTNETHSLSDEDYKLLYYFAFSCAGGSGDDTLTMLLSSNNVPFFINAVHSIKEDNSVQFFELLKELKLEALSALWQHLAGEKTAELLKNKKDNMTPAEQKDFDEVCQKMACILARGVEDLPQEVERLKRHFFEKFNIMNYFEDTLKKHYQTSQSLILSTVQGAGKRNEASDDPVEKALNSKLILSPDKRWKLNKERKAYWLEVPASELASCKEVIKSKSLEECLTVSKTKGREAFVLFLAEKEGKLMKFGQSLPAKLRVGCNFLMI